MPGILAAEAAPWRCGGSAPLNPTTPECARFQLLLITPLQAVGDAMSGILLVEAALRRRGWGLPDWGALYADLPSRQLKARLLLSLLPALAFVLAAFSSRLRRSGLRCLTCRSHSPI